jgi:ABC-type transport system substrate-binding protein
MSLRLRFGALLIALALVAAAGGASRAADGAQPQAETPVSGGTLNVVAEQQVDGFNIYDSCCNELWAGWEEAPVLLGAFVQLPDGSYQPQLVTSVDVATSPSFRLTYHIDPAAVWSDGQQVTADDFIFTWQSIVDPANSVSGTAGYDQITSMTALDTKTVRVVFSSPYAPWRTLFAPVLPEHALNDQDFDSIWTNGIVDPHTGKPIGDGPFLMTGYSASTQVTLTRNPRWWGSHAAYLSSIVFHVANTTTEESEMASGQVQAIFPTTGNYLQPLLTASGVAFQSGIQPYFENLWFNIGGAERGPLEDQSWVRQAIAHAIDRSAIANNAFSALVPSWSANQSLLYFPGQAGYSADFAGYSYSTSEVASLMGAHGCALGGDGIWVCSGHRMSFTVAYTQGNSTRQQEANTMASDAQAAGIELVPTPISSSTIFGSGGIPGGHFQLAIFAEITTGDPSDWVDIYACGRASNWWGYCNSSVDTGFDAVGSDLDPTQRIADAQSVDQLLAGDVAALPIFNRPEFIFYSTSVRGLENNPNLDGPLWNAQNVWLAPSVAAPDVTSFTPTQGTTGTSVTLTGTGFTGATGVSFGGTAASGFSVASDTQITATVASGTQTGPVTVTGPGGSGTSSALFYTPPSISSFTPSSAAAHATVTVTGTSILGATSVKLNGASVPFTIVSNTKITFTVPTGASNGTILVTAPAGSGTSAGTFTVLPPPTIASISPGSGPVGTLVTVTGTGLAGTVGIQIGSVLTVPTSVSATQVVFSIPPGAATGTIKILATNGSATSVDTFTITS